MDPSQPSFDLDLSVEMLLISLFLVLLNGFFVLSEFSIVKVRRSKLEELAKDGRAGARRALHISTHLDTYLSACQLGITLSSLGLGWVGEPAVARLLSSALSPLALSPLLIHSLSFIIAFSLITLLHVVLGELVPKSIAIARAERASLLIAGPLHLFWLIFLPFIKIFDLLAGLTLRLFKISPAKESELSHSEEEIKIIASESQKGGVIDEFESELIRNAVDFSDTVAKEIMTPRKDMICLNKQKSYAENIQIICENHHTRFPYIDGSKDAILGIIHIRDLVQNEFQKRGAALDEFVRPMILVPENLSISRVLVLMNEARSQNALVIDEYGGTAGLLTMEDIMEEIIGEIHSENEEEAYKKISEHIYEVQGRYEIERAGDLLGISYPEDLEQVTIGGYVFHLAFHLLGRPPAAGDRIEDEHCYYEVKKMDANSIERVKLIKKDEPEIKKEPK